MNTNYSNSYVNPANIDNILPQIKVNEIDQKQTTENVTPDLPDLSSEKATKVNIPSLFHVKIYHQKQLEETLTEESGKCDDIDTEILSYEKFLEKCVVQKEELPDTNELKNRYEMYQKLKTTKNALLERYGMAIFNTSIIRQWKAFELYVMLRPSSFYKDQQGRSDWEDLQNCCILFDELAKKDYPKEEVSSILKVTFSMNKFRPTAQQFKTQIEGQLLVKKVDEIASKIVIPKKELKTSRKLWFVPKDDDKGYLAKYTVGIDPDEIAAFGLSQLLGTPFIPLTRKIDANDARLSLKTKGTVQEFFNENVYTISEYLKEKSNAADVLNNIPNHYVHLYLIQAIVLGQNDGHLNNTFIKLNNDGSFKGLIDFDNEILLSENYPKFGKFSDNEGKGNGRIALLGLKQARVPLSRAMLILFSSSFFERKILQFFINKNKSLKERLNKIKKICDFAKDHEDCAISPEKIYFELFPNEDYLIRSRKNGIPDLLAFQNFTQSYSNQILDIKRVKAKHEKSAFYWSNLKQFITPLPDDYPALHNEQYGGKEGIQNVQELFNSLPVLPFEYELIELDVKEIDMNLYEKCKKETIDPFLSSLFLKGTPAIVARRIERGYPGTPLRIQKQENGKYVLMMGLPPIIKETLEQFSHLFNEIRAWQRNPDEYQVDTEIPIPPDVFDAFKRCKFQLQGYINDLSMKDDFKNFPKENYAYLILWIYKTTKKACIHEVRKENECFFQIKLNK